MIRYMDGVDFLGKRVLIRPDFNCPMVDKKITNDTRIREGSKSIKELSDKGARVVVMAHQGQPGEPDFTHLDEHAEILQKYIGKPVKFVHDVIGPEAIKAIESLKDSEVLLLDNVRLIDYEFKNMPAEEHEKTAFVQILHKHFDYYINDAFSVAHRSNSSTTGFYRLLPCLAGRIMQRELDALSRVSRDPKHPYIMILGGVKSKESVKMMGFLAPKVDKILLGGVLSQIFLATRYDLGKKTTCFLESGGFTGFIPKAKELLEKYPGKIEVPVDVVSDADGVMTVGDLPAEGLIKDIGPETTEKYRRIIRTAKTINMNGPLGVFEEEDFFNGTKSVYESSIDCGAFVLAGGGHTVEALEKFGLTKKVSFISLSGKALLMYLSGETLPAVAALDR